MSDASISTDLDQSQNIFVLKTRFRMALLFTGDELDLKMLKENPAFLSGLIRVFEVLYVSINNEMCESSLVCKECAKKRDRLREYLDIFDRILEGEELPEDVVKINWVPETLKEVIDRINTLTYDYGIRTI